MTKSQNYSYYFYLSVLEGLLLLVCLTGYNSSYMMNFVNLVQFKVILILNPGFLIYTYMYDSIDNLN
jgi:hypothetical protein